MIKYKHFKALFVATLLTLACVRAQGQEFVTSIYLNGVLPTGEFNDKVDIYHPISPLSGDAYMDRLLIAKGASAGLGGTFRGGIWFDIGFGQLQPFAEASFLWNAVNKDIRSTYDKTYKNEECPHAPAYFNLPMMLGLQYRYDLTNIIRPYAELGIGYDVLFISGNGYKENKPWYTYKPSGKLCWMLGAGTYLGDYVSVGIIYQNFGSHRIDYTAKSSGREDGGTFDHTERRSLGEFGIRVGFHF